ncbi:hypothetical protein RFI_09980, partial [Reticulomyxa filosa]
YIGNKVYEQRENRKPVYREDLCAFASKTFSSRYGVKCVIANMPLINFPTAKSFKENTRLAILGWGALVDWILAKLSNNAINLYAQWYADTNDGSKFPFHFFEEVGFTAKDFETLHSQTESEQEWKNGFTLRSLYEISSYFRNASQINDLICVENINIPVLYFVAKDDKCCPPNTTLLAKTKCQQTVVYNGSHHAIYQSEHFDNMCSHIAKFLEQHLLI